MSKKHQEPQNEEVAYTSILGDDAESAEFMEQLAAEEKKEEEKKEKEKTAKKGSRKPLVIAGISVASAALVGCLTFAGIHIYNQNKVQVAASTANYQVDQKVLACFYQDMISMFVSNYGEETLLTSYGMDVSMPLKDQVYPYDETVTWFDMLMDQTLTSIQQQLVMYEAANAAGHTMTEAEAAQMEEAIAAADLTKYGNGVTEEDVRKAVEIQALTSSYYNHFMTTTEFTEDEINAYYEANCLNYQTCGLGGFSVSYVTEEGEEGISQAEAEAVVNNLQDAANAEEFEEIVADYLVNYEGYTEADLESMLPTLFYDGYTYTEGSELAEWAFKEAKLNDTYMLEGEGSYYVYMLTGEPTRDETPTVDVRHILFMSEEDNMAAAEALLAEWESGEATEDSFAALANERSEDPGSNTNGGLYEGVYPGEMVDTFNDWCFDESRKAGDTGIVETSYGVHVMYFSGNAGPMWEASITTELLNAAYYEWYTELEALYPVTINEDAAGSIDG